MSGSPVLVVNAGSSSLKVKLFPHGHALLVERIGGAVGASGPPSLPIDVSAVTGHDAALHACLRAIENELALTSIKLVGHRVVHGGERYTAPVVLDAEAIVQVERLSALAPLHNPANVKAIRAARQLLPHARHVAVFDTAFHATLPPRAYLYGLPYRYYLEHGIRRYGFHGTSHDFVTRRAAGMMSADRADLRLVSLHLGNGASAAAVKHGESVDTSMGFTPLDGLLMGTRSGEIDPGVLLHLLEAGMTAEQLNTLLNKESGLLGVSGVSNDVRDIHREAEAGNERARLALEVLCHRIKKVIGSYAAVMGGLDGVVFTGGIGENDPVVRAAALEGLDFLGIALDAGRNAANAERISADASRVAVTVVAADEEQMIAEAVRAILAADG